MVGDGDRRLRLHLRRQIQQKAAVRTHIVGSHERAGIEQPIDACDYQANVLLAQFDDMDFGSAPEE